MALDGLWIIECKCLCERERFFAERPLVHGVETEHRPADSRDLKFVALSWVARSFYIGFYFFFV